MTPEPAPLRYVVLAEEAVSFSWQIHHKCQLFAKSLNEAGHKYSTLRLIPKAFGFTVSKILVICH